MDIRDQRIVHPKEWVRDFFIVEQSGQNSSGNNRIHPIVKLKVFARNDRSVNGNFDCLFGFPS